jgi:short-subunit dehydrogenase
VCPIDLLVNNAGFGSHGRFAELDRDVEADLVELNVVALVRLTHAAVGPMVARRRGGIINVSSVAGVQPTPYAATYGASKAFVTSFTHAVHEEVRGAGVRMMVLVPGYTHSEFHQRIDARTGAPGRERGGWLWQTSDAVVEAALRSYTRGASVCVPGWWNRLTASLSGPVSDRLTRRVAARVTRPGF